ncbi:TlpA disulfide reductase family protein [Frateuria defendens]|uniref:TlpA disulfide reductase family protein n=1 Tax=Frateuria defendens TaxID=2219559 RepID=UPI000AAD8319|nr:TlpA disulfide reductase family protein [Frateuria defendens]
MSRASWLILTLAVLAAGLGGWWQHRARQPAAGLIGQAVPDLTLDDLDGRPHRLGDYRGRRVLLNLWASWCGPCLKEMPALSAAAAQAQAKSGEHAPIVLGIAMDDPQRVRAFLAAHPVGYPVLLGRFDNPSTSTQLGDEAGLLPYSVLLDGEGRVLAIRRGTLDAAQLAAWLAPDGQP